MNLFLPLDSLGIDVLKDSPPILLRAGSLVNRLLTSAIEIWLGELRNLRLAETANLEASILGLVRGLLKQGHSLTAESQILERVRNHAVREYIEEHLANPDFGPGSIIEHFPGSRTSLYREFSEEGGLARYIARRRLERALADLAGGPPQRGQISKAAFNVGYVDPFHFSKSFKSHFGFPPSDVLALSASTFVSETGS